ncbi:MAG TPA: hypothetical protein VK858_12180, partial [Longimicrobiales bacterium]|nr:hypothetical protein [Longimicrobiales bacterium]
LSLFYETASISDPEVTGWEDLSVFSTLVAAQTELGRRVRLGVSSGYARGELTRLDGSSATLSGMLDTEVTLSVPFANDFVVLSLVGILPTGNSEQDADEAEVASIVAAELLPFRVSHWGAGGGFGANVGFARPVGSVGLAFGLGYVLGAEYNPVTDEDFAYRPGNAFTVSAGLDATVGRAGKVAVQAAFHSFSDDQLDGGNLYQAGDRFQVMGSYAFPVASGTGIAYAGIVHRGGGAVGDEGDALSILGSPSQDLVLVGGGVRLAVGNGILVPDLAVRVFRRADAVGQGYVGRLGVAYELPLGSLDLIPAVRAKLGSVEDALGMSSGLSGWDIGVTLRYREAGR